MAENEDVILFEGGKVYQMRTCSRCGAVFAFNVYKDYEPAGMKKKSICPCCGNREMIDEKKSRMTRAEVAHEYWNGGDKE